jgi:hypothetical protein
MAEMMSTSQSIEITASSNRYSRYGTMTQKLIVQNRPERGWAANALVHVTTVRTLIFRAVQNLNRHTFGKAVRVAFATIA